MQNDEDLSIVQWVRERMARAAAEGSVYPPPLPYVPRWKREQLAAEEPAK